MKKLTVFFLLVALSLVLCACGSPAPAQSDPTPSSSEAAPVPAEPVVIEYPKASTSKYLSYATSIPEVVWTTPAEKNGLAGSVYEIIGTVTAKEPLDMGTPPIESEYILIQTEDGVALVLDYYNYTKDYAELQGQKENFNSFMAEKDSDYTMPGIGEYVRAVCTYSGFSEAMKMPAFYLGANEYLVESLLHPAVPEPENNEKEDIPAAEPEKPTEPEYKPSTGEKNALKAAKQYLNVMSFSYSGLIEQLEYEGYTLEEAVYGVDNCQADWNAQSKKAAKQYLDLMPFSRSELIDQLIYDGFTAEQAEYGAEQNGL